MVFHDIPTPRPRNGRGGPGTSPLASPLAASCSFTWASSLFALSFVGSLLPWLYPRGLLLYPCLSPCSLKGLQGWGSKNLKAIFNPSSSLSFLPYLDHHRSLTRSFGIRIGSSVLNIPECLPTVTSSFLEENSTDSDIPGPDLTLTRQMPSCGSCPPEGKPHHSCRPSTRVPGTLGSQALKYVRMAWNVLGFSKAVSGLGLEISRLNCRERKARPRNETILEDTQVLKTGISLLSNAPVLTTGRHGRWQQSQRGNR